MHDARLGATVEDSSATENGCGLHREVRHGAEHTPDNMSWISRHRNKTVTEGGGSPVQR
jgi:hypothetical protein